MARLDDDDEGKTVVTADGDTVGTVVEVENGNAHVDPDPGVTDEIAAKLGWGDTDEGTYELDEKIATISDDKIRLEGHH